MIPTTYLEWRDCMINKCKIPLTKEFAQKRLDVYMNKKHPETKKFVVMYGEQHLQNIIRWYQQV